MISTLSTQPTNLFDHVFQVLQRDYIYVDEIAWVLALAIKSNKNVLLWGPGGHAKSEMVRAALYSLFAKEDVFIQAFGEGMDESKLWGGFDIKKFEETGVIEYFPEYSFLAKPVAIFEELFDAPPVVLLPLKNTLTEGELQNGNQRYRMSTKVIFALTNKDPKDIGELGPAAQALIERFPLQLKVKWDSYKSSDFIQLFNKVSPRIPGADMNGTADIMAEVIAKVIDEGSFISPRTAVHAVGTVKAAAAMRESNVVEKQDLLVLRFLPGMEKFAATLKSELDAAFERAEAERRLIAAEHKLQALIEEFDTAKVGRSPLKLLTVSKKLTAFGDETQNLKVVDALIQRRKQLRDSAASKASEAQALALEYTLIKE